MIPTKTETRGRKKGVRQKDHTEIEVRERYTALKPDNHPERCKKAEQELREKFGHIWYRYRLYRASRDKTLIIRCKHYCDVFGYKFMDLKPILLNFLDLDKI